MNILVLEDKASNQFGGAEKSMFSYVKHLKELGHNIVLVYDKDGDWLKESNRTVFSHIYKLDLSHIRLQKLNLIKTVKELRKICQKHNIEKILTHTIHCFPLIRILKNLVKVEFIVYFKWILNYNRLGILNNWGAKAIDHALANSNYVANYWHKHIPNLTIGMVPDGIDVNHSSHMNESCTQINTLLFIGRLYEGKGLHILIKALKEFKNLELIVCGEFEKDTNKGNSPYELEIKSLIHELDLEHKVRLLGYVEKPQLYMKSNVLVVIPSIWPEAQSLVLLESMMSKTSVIVSNRGGTVDVVGDKMEECTFTPNLEDTVAKIKQFLKMDLKTREQICESLNQRFYNNYTMENTHKKLDAILL